MDKKGFSLIEVLISSCLLLLVTLASLQILLTSLLIKKKAEINFLATRIAYQKLEYLKSFPFESDTLKEGSGEEEVILPGFKGKYRRRWQISDVSPSLKKIEIKAWLENSSRKKTELILYLSKELGF
ncbi:MAG: hypothetical protein ACE5WD_12165 [Candidatus Aminicenantia bacterium]